MSEQIGWRGLVAQLRTELTFWPRTLPQLPRLLHRFLDDAGNQQVANALQRLADETHDQTRVLALIAIALVGACGLLLYLLK